MRACLPSSKAVNTCNTEFDNRSAFCFDNRFRHTCCVSNRDQDLLQYLALSKITAGRRARQLRRTEVQEEGLLRMLSLSVDLCIVGHDLALRRLSNCGASIGMRFELLHIELSCPSLQESPADSSCSRHSTAWHSTIKSHLPGLFR